MPGSSVFPAFIRAEYDPSGGGFPAFEQAARASADRARSHFQSSFTEIQRIAQQALAAPRNAGGSLDLNVGQYREAAAAANAQAIALREVATAAERAAIANGDTSESTRLYVQASRAAALEAENNARSAGQQAVAMERLQSELNQTASRTQAVIAGNRGLIQSNDAVALSARAARFGYVQLGQQMQDVVIQAQAGVNPFQIMVQQGTQASFALAQLGGTLGRVGTFLAGPWGTALFIATAALGSLITKLWEGEEAAKAAELGASGLSEAQSVLGEMFDLTSGKLERQNDLLRLNARLTALNLRAEASAERARARTTFGEVGERSMGGRFGAFISTEGGGGVLDILRRQDELRGRASRQSQLYDALIDKRISIEEALQQTEKMDFSGLEVSKQDFQQALVDTMSAAYKDETARLIDQSLNSGVLAPELRREGRTRKPKDRTKELERLEEFGEDAARRIADITGRFSGQPRLIEQVAKASRQLDDILDDIERRKPPNYQELVASVKEAREVLERAPARPFREMIDALDRELDVGALIAQGREQDAEILREKQALMEQLGAESEEELETILRQAGVEGDINQMLRDRLELSRQQAREAEILRRRQSAYLDAVGAVRSNIQQTIEGLSTRGLGGSITDFFEDLGDTFNRLTSELITQKLFDPIFDKISDQIKGLDPLEQAATESATALDTTTTAATAAAKALNSLAVSAGGAAAANDNEVGPDYTVSGSRLPTLDPVSFFNKMGSELLQAIGVNKELADEIGNLGTLLEGAGYGQMAGGLLLGKGGSQTGSAIGGALGQVAGKAMQEGVTKLLGETLGQFAGPLGGIIGGIAGGLLGSALSGTKRASATIAFGDAGLGVASTRGNSRQRERASVDAADSAVAMIERIAEQLGGTITGVGSVSIGVREGNFRVDPSGRGITKTKKGAIDFGEDAEAAVLAATLDLIKDGMIGGLRASTQNLLRGAKDLALGIEKALKFESVFVRLKEFTNPVGAALDALDKEFMGLVKIFEEAGASAAELADLQKLYELERAEAIKQASEQMTGALKALLDDLTINNDTRSLRERLSAAMAAYNPLADKIESGQFTGSDADAFAEAARNVLDIQRQLSGSQSDYFALEDQIKDLTKKALDERQALIDQTTGGAAANDNPSPVVDAIDRLSDRLAGILTGQLGAVNDNIGRVIRAGGSAGGRTFPEFRNRDHF